MATSKHFPVQNYAAHSDGEDFYEDTAYNSVTSFKSYQYSNRSVLHPPKYQSNGMLSKSLPLPASKPNQHKGSMESKDSADTTDIPEACYIDNTVVSAYSKEKSYLLHTKPTGFQNPGLRQSLIHQETSNKLTKVKQSDVGETLGQHVRILETLEERCSKENKRELPEAKNKQNFQSESSRINTHNDLVEKYSCDSVQDLLTVPEPFNREEEVSTPKSDNSDSGRHSAGSRRQLPKVPVRQDKPVQEIKIKPVLNSSNFMSENNNKPVSVNLSNAKKLHSFINATESVPKISSTDNVNRKIDLKKSVNPSSKVGEVKQDPGIKYSVDDKKYNSVLDTDDATAKLSDEMDKVKLTEPVEKIRNEVENTEIAVNYQIVKRRAKPRVREKKRSQSTGVDSTISASFVANLTTSKRGETYEKNMDRDKLKTNISANYTNSSQNSIQEQKNKEDLNSNLEFNSLQKTKIRLDERCDQTNCSDLPKVNEKLIKVDMELGGRLNLNPSLPSVKVNVELGTKDVLSKEFEDDLNRKTEDVQNQYSVTDALNDIVDDATEELVKRLPENSVFSFTPEEIQELTDSVMQNKNTVGVKLPCSRNEYCVKSQNLDNYSNDNTFLESTNRLSDKKNKSHTVKSKTEGKLHSNQGIQNQMHKDEHKLKARNSIDVSGKPTVDQCENVSSNNTTNENNDLIVNTKVIQPNVERSPSYRKKVMARAKKRYKKSSMLKECSCTRNDTGEILMCQFCVNYETMKRRSRSSLGLESAGLDKESVSYSENDTNEMSFSGTGSPRRAFTPGLPPRPSSKSPRPVRKVPISSRVDVLMSSDLFRKHLTKHENLLQKHTMFRRAGIRKSVSNLDLSEGFTVDYDSQCETESIASEANHDNDQDTDKDDISIQSCDLKSSKQDPRRRSLSGESDNSSTAENKNKRKHVRTLPKTVGRTRPDVPSFTQPKVHPQQSRSAIPSFTEYKSAKELSKSTETLNILDSESDIPKQSTEMDEPKDIHSTLFTTGNVARMQISKENSEKQEESSISEQVIPLQLQVIKESDSRENLLLSSSRSLDSSDLNDSTTKSYQNDGSNTEHGSEVNVKHIEEQGKDSVTENEYENLKGQEIKSGISIRIEDTTKSVKGSDPNKHGLLTSQQSMPNLSKQRARTKLKARTLSNLELDSEYQSDTGVAGPRCHSALSTRERRKPGAKRPRSLISKKSSLASLIQDAENLAKNSDGESNSESIKLRPKLKAGHVSRSKSDSKYEKDKDDVARNVSFADKGNNLVNFDIEDMSQCSAFDIGESETSTSIGDSLSDSIRSEVNTEENFKLPNDFDDTRKLLPETDDVDDDEDSLTKQLKEDISSQVLRSTSDACEITPEAARKRRERKERPYKSDPFSGTEIIPATKRCALREERAKLRQRLDLSHSSKEQILTFLEEVSHGDLDPCESVASLEELNEDYEQLKFLSEGNTELSRKLHKHHSNVSSLSTDSGVIGQDGSHDSPHSSPSNTLSHSQSERNMSRSHYPHHKGRSQSASCADFAAQHMIGSCVDCGPADMIDSNCSQVCPPCMKHRVERKETIQEIIETEMNYGRDLNILKEEFYRAIMKAGLLNKEQLDAIFLNLDELIHVNKHFVSKIKSAICSAIQNNDNDYESVMIGCLFLESSTMFLTFENYCVNQAQAPVLLEQLEREKELLRIFLQVSQNDNQQLRRMHLKSFLMVPVQRIMRYPLLLDRLYKTTPRNHSDKSSLKEAKEKIEDILGHINSKSRTTSFRQRKPSQKSQQNCSVNEKIEVSRVALETLQWNRKDVCDVITSQLQVTQPVDHMWATKKCKNYKFTNVYGVLLTLMQPNEKIDENENTTIKTGHSKNNNNENTSSRVQSAAVVFIKEKNGRFQVLRDPFMLEKCVVSQDPDFPEVFEILEWSKEAFLIKADTPQETKLWVHNLRQQMNNLGVWRKRRNALPNILLNPLT